MVAANETFAHRQSPVKEIHVVWMTTGLGCDGDSVSITAARPDSADATSWDERAASAAAVPSPRRASRIWSWVIFPGCPKCMCTIR